MGRERKGAKLASPMWYSRMVERELSRKLERLEVL
jgi:hypothetical protein